MTGAGQAGAGHERWDSEVTRARKASRAAPVGAARLGRCRGGGAADYFCACLTASCMSALMRVIASSTDISPTMACVTRATVGSMIARLNL